VLTIVRAWSDKRRARSCVPAKVIPANTEGFSIMHTLPRPYRQRH
jgi:hypothetical protein